MKKLSLFFGLLFTLSGFAGSHKAVPYSLKVIDQKTYDKISKDGKPIFLAFNANWCPVCQKQNKALGSLKDQFKGKAHIYTVDWDKRKEFSFPSPNQRTTLVFMKNNKIEKELIGITNKDALRAFIKSNSK
jgi:thiol-disulfide isomerase/thioredoxin